MGTKGTSLGKEQLTLMPAISILARKRSTRSLSRLVRSSSTLTKSGLCLAKVKLIRELS